MVTSGTRDAASEAALLADVGHAFDVAGTDLRVALTEVCRIVSEWSDHLVWVRLIDDIPALSLGLVWDADPVAAAAWVRYLEEGAALVLETQARYAELMAAPVGLFGAAFEQLKHGDDQRLAAVIQESGAVGGALAPLRVAGRVTGLIGVQCHPRCGGVHGDGWVRFIGEIADRVALAAENARLVGRLRNELEQRSRVERRHAAFLHHATDVVVVVDERARILDATPAITSVLGWAPEAFTGADMFLAVHADDVARVRGFFAEVLGRPGPSPAIEFRAIDGRGGTVWVEALANNLLHDPAVRAIVITSRDITERHQAAELLAAENAVLAAIAEGAPIQRVLDDVCRIVESGTGGVAAIWRLEDSRGLVFWAGPSMPEDVFDTDRPAMGGDPDEWIDQTVDRIDVADPDVHAQWAGWRQEAERFGIRRSWTRAIVDPHGSVLGALIVYLEEERDPTDREAQVVQLATQLAGVALDRDRAGQAMAHAATHDALTGLPNRRLLLERLGALLREGTPCGVLFIDLDDFKHVNDTSGHAAGDRLLQEAAARVAEVLRPGDTVARMGGDEFAVLCGGVSCADDVGTVASRVLGAVSHPFVAGTREFHLSASIGIALGEEGSTAASLLRDADAAMYQAKADGRGRHAVFTPDVRRATVERRTVERELRRAIDQGELVAHYQPIVDLHRGRVGAVEALVRWEHPTQGLVLPAGFIGVAETTGLVVPLGEVVLDQVCRQMATWIRGGIVEPSAYAAVNVSVLQLLDPGLPAAVLGALDRAGLSPLNLHLEITETAVMSDGERAHAAMHELREHGVRFVIDDFGTGHSSLARLRSIDAEILKLDRSFVADLTDDPASTEIVASVVHLAHALGKGLVAEGVETAGQLAVVRRLGADAAQGYHLARPVPAAALEALLATNPRW